MALIRSIEIPEEFINEFGEIIYPDSDGKRMADNTKQFEWIATIKGNLDSVFAKQADVFVAGDLLWYPVEGLPHLRVAPDVLVAFGRPKGHRGSYQQWKEDNVTPQVVFEILSPGNTAAEMLKKWRFYNKYGVLEYYIYDPDGNEFYTWTRTGMDLAIQITEPEWNSSLLGVKFILEEDTLKIYDPAGKPFLTYIERVEAENRAIAEENKAIEEEKKAVEEAKAEKQAKIKAIEEAEAEKQAKIKAIEEAEAEKQAKIKAIEEVEAEKQAKIKAIEEAEAEKQAKQLALNEIVRLRELLKQKGFETE